jgi:hypothetical protein
MEENTRAGSAAQVRRLLLREGRGDAKELEGPAQFQVINVQKDAHDTRRMLHVCHATTQAHSGSCARGTTRKECALPNRHLQAVRGGKHCSTARRPTRIPAKGASARDSPGSRQSYEKDASRCLTAGFSSAAPHFPTIVIMCRWSRCATCIRPSSSAERRRLPRAPARHVQPKSE